MHLDAMKIRMLIDKIKADFLSPAKAQLEIDISRMLMTIMCNQAIALFGNTVNQKHPPQMNANRVRCNVNKVTSRKGGKCNQRGGNGDCGGRGGRGRSDAKMVTLTDRTQIECHGSYNFPRHVYLKMKQEYCNEADFRQ